jgi:hypothetical protein
MTLAAFNASSGNDRRASVDSLCVRAQSCKAWRAESLGDPKAARTGWTLVPEATTSELDVGGTLQAGMGFSDPLPNAVQ